MAHIALALHSTASRDHPRTYWQSACPAQAATTTGALTCSVYALQDDHTAADYYFDSYAHFGTRSSVCCVTHASIDCHPSTAIAMHCLQPQQSGEPNDRVGDGSIN